MAQLKEDEWPGDGEATTSEQEGDAVKREGPNPPGRKTGHSDEAIARTPYQPVINNVEPDQQGD
jgi:hypothetical protein